MKVINQAHSENWALYHGDAIEVTKGIPDDSLDYSIFSPPFRTLFTFSNSAQDISNCKTDDEFAAHFQFLIRELYRCLKPGRLVSFHCMNLPTSKTRDGYIGLSDFRGELIRAFQAEGFIFHSEVVIWKDPIIAMQRTKSLGLLHKQMCKDSAMSRQGIPDYLITMRKRGDNPDPLAGMLLDYVGDDPEFEKYAYKSPDFMSYFRKMLDGYFTGKYKLGSEEMSRSIDIWSRYASPVWMDINPSDTLQHRSAKANDDERHISPLQLQVIDRALQLWTKPGDVVLDPFNGIGSTGHVCLRQNRKYVGIELKKSYYDAAVNNLTNAETSKQGQLAFA